MSFFGVMPGFWVSQTPLRHPHLFGRVWWTSQKMSKVRVSAFNFRKKYPSVCTQKYHMYQQFVKSDSNKLLSFRSSSDCFLIIRSSSEGGFCLWCCLLEFVGAAPQRPCQTSLLLLNKNVWLSCFASTDGGLVPHFGLLVNTDSFVICLECLSIT